MIAKDLVELYAARQETEGLCMRTGYCMAEENLRKCFPMRRRKISCMAIEDTKE